MRLFGSMICVHRQASVLRGSGQPTGQCGIRVNEQCRVRFVWRCRSMRHRECRLPPVHHGEVRHDVGVLDLSPDPARFGCRRASVANRDRAKDRTVRRERRSCVLRPRRSCASVLGLVLAVARATSHRAGRIRMRIIEGEPGDGRGLAGLRPVGNERLQRTLPDRRLVAPRQCLGSSGFLEFGSLPDVNQIAAGTEPVWVRQLPWWSELERDSKM